ncbi:putative outer membrane protein [Dirofilaria immitis]|nr:putative outer membrane protein [Dirofilaria immitis]
MASPKRSKDHSNKYITVSNPKKNGEGSKRILRLGDTEFLVNEEQMIATSNFLRRILIYAIALSFANEHVRIPLNQDMHKAISEQLYILTRQTISAPFVINFAVCNLENDKTKCIVKHSSIIEKDEKKAAIESVVRSIKVWCSNDDQRYTDGIIEIEESWLEGAELGISASGKLDVRDHKFQVEGQACSPQQGPNGKDGKDGSKGEKGMPGNSGPRGHQVAVGRPGMQGGASVIGRRRLQGPQVIKGIKEM